MGWILNTGDRHYFCSGVWRLLRAERGFGQWLLGSDGEFGAQRLRRCIIRLNNRDRVTKQRLMKHACFPAKTTRNMAIHMKKGSALLSCKRGVTVLGSLSIWSFYSTGDCNEVIARVMSWVVESGAFPGGSATII